MRRNPARSGSSVWSWNHSSFIASKSNARLPREPLTSRRSAFFRPVAKRVASNVPSPPPDSRAVNTAASSTLTSPVAVPPFADSPDEASASGRRVTKVAVCAETSVSSSPVTNWARSIACAPMSPSAPEPAFSRCSRQTSGNAGSAIQSCR